MMSIVGMPPAVGSAATAEAAPENEAPEIVPPVRLILFIAPPAPFGVSSAVNGSGGRTVQVEKRSTIRRLSRLKTTVARETARFTALCGNSPDFGRAGAV